MCSLSPEWGRHAENPEFRAGLRHGRAQRQSTEPERSRSLSSILKRPELRILRQNLRELYAAAALNPSDTETSRLWEAHTRASRVYDAAINRFCAVRKISPRAAMAS